MEIKATVYERSDGMAIFLIPHGDWIIRAPVRGQTKFWNRNTWILVSLVKTKLVNHQIIWPEEFCFEKEEAMNFLENYQYQDY